MQGFLNIDDYPELKEKWKDLSREDQMAFLNMSPDMDSHVEKNVDGKCNETANEFFHREATGADNRVRLTEEEGDRFNVWFRKKRGMISEEQLSQIVKKQTEKNEKFWAGKPKLTKEQLESISKSTNDKYKPLEEYFSKEENRKHFDDLLYNADREYLKQWFFEGKP